MNPTARSRPTLAAAALAILALGPGCPGKSASSTPPPTSPAKSETPYPGGSTATQSPTPEGQPEHSEVVTKVTPTPTPTSTPPPQGPRPGEQELSSEFPEIGVTISRSFAHDVGERIQVAALSVGGRPCAGREAIAALVALRKGWSRSGGSSDSDVLETLRAYEAAWREALEPARRATSDSAPPDLERLLSAPGVAGQPRVRSSEFPGVPAYHPPRAGIYALDNGERIAVISWFESFDGGDLGTVWKYEVDAYQLRDGTSYELTPLQGWRGSVPTPPSGPQPVDPQTPRPCRLGH